MPVISLLNQKGGVGKTTIALHLAYELAKSGSVLLIDADPQSSSLDWSTQREDKAPFAVMGFPKKVLHREIGSLSSGYAWTVIDGPPASTDIATSAISASDLVIIPVQPSPLDTWAAQKILDTLSEVMTIKPHIQGRFVINRLMPNTTLGREVAAGLETYPEITTLPTAIHNRTEYAKAMRLGKVAQETEPAGKAAADIAQLTHHILHVFGGTQ